MEKSNEIREQVSEHLQKEKKKTSRDLAVMLQLIEYLPNMHKALGFNPQHFINWVWWCKRNSRSFSSQGYNMRPQVTNSQNKVTSIK